MNRLLLRLLVVSVVLAGRAAFAQIELGFAIYPARAMLFETVAVQFAMKNNAREDITLGSNGNARVYFDVRTLDRNLVKRVPGSSLEGTVVPARETLVVSNRVVPGRYITLPGAYMIEARVEWGEKAFISKPQHLDVVLGAELTRLEASTRNGQRLYSIRTLQRDRHQNLLLRVDNADTGVCITVIDLGRTVGGEAPILQIDDDDRLHILQQHSPTRYRHWIINPEGDVLDLESHDSPFGPPKLAEDDSGELSVDIPEASAEPTDPKPEPFKGSM